MTSPQPMSRLLANYTASNLRQVGDALETTERNIPKKKKQRQAISRYLGGAFSLLLDRCFQTILPITAPAIGSIFTKGSLRIAFPVKRHMARKRLALPAACRFLWVCFADTAYRGKSPACWPLDAAEEGPDGVEDARVFEFLEDAAI